METSAHRKGMQRSPFASSGTSFSFLLSSILRNNLESLYEACADGDIYTPGHLHTVRVCKGPPLHYAPKTILISLRSGLLTYSMF
jgi:hypothetical protein